MTLSWSSPICQGSRARQSLNVFSKRVWRAKRAIAWRRHCARWPAAMRVAPLARQSGVMVRFRPFLLGPLFKAQGWATSLFNLYPAKGRYMWRDLERICFDLDLPFRQPEPFPQNSLLAARVALVGLSSSWGEEFCRGVFQAEFGDGRQIDDSTIIGDILSQLQIEAAPVLEAARAETNKAALRAQTGQAKQLGIFGAPTFATADGELFWGNDRLERAIAWARMGFGPIATD